MVTANATCGMGEREEFARGSRGQIGQGPRCLCAYVDGHYVYVGVRWERRAKCLREGRRASL